MKITSLAISLAWSLSLAGQIPSDGQISGPFTHENLSLFLVRAQQGAKTGSRYLTLQDAMDQRKIVVTETKKVNELAVENISVDPIYIQSGDIVKGGQQDRVITNDFVLPPKSGRIAVDAFCVEQGRWSRRGSESASTFNSSSELVPTKPMKMAVIKQNQSEVWQQVAEAQRNLALATAQTVTVSASASSLPLTLKSRAVENAVKGYIKALRQIPDGRGDVVGLVFAVNGEINSADIYSSPELFAAMWPKLLKASAVEALRLKRQELSTAVKTTEIGEFLRDAEEGSERRIDVDRRITLIRRENGREITTESLDPQGWIHRNVIKQ
jgi:hypothetical protein